MIVLAALLGCVGDDPPRGAGPAGETGGGPSEATDTGVRAGLDADALRAALDAAATRNDGWGGVALSVRGAGLAPFDGVAGARSRGGEALAVGDAFEIASVTKTFTAALVLTLVDAGELSLDDPLGALLPGRLPALAARDGRDVTAEVTVRQLLQQTSGFADYWTDPPFVRPGVNAFLARFLADEEHHWTLAELVEAAGRLDPVAAPGVGWHYADTNYVVLGLVIEARLGMSFEAALRARVLDPLGLVGTWMKWEEGGPGLPLAARYEGRRDLTAYEHQSADHVGGGLASTTADLLRFAEGVAGGELFGVGLFEAMREAVPTGVADVGYGLGVFTVALDDGTSLWGHDGYGGAFVYHWPARGAAWAGTIDQTNRSSEPLQGAALGAVFAAR